MGPQAHNRLLDFPAHASGEDHLRFERFLSDVAAALLNLGSRDMDRPVSASLGDLVTLVGGDRGGIAQFSEDGRSLRYTHPFPGRAAPPLEPGLAAAGHWYVGELRAGRRVVLPRLPESLPEEARTARAGVARDGLKSHLSLPLKVGGEVLGTLCMDHLEEHRSWSPELLTRLELLASLYAHTFYRRRAEDRLRAIHDLNRSVLASVSSEIVVLDREGRVVTVNESWARSARRKTVTPEQLAPGSDYLAAAEEALARGQVAGRQDLAGLRAVLSGERPSFRATYRYESAGPDEPPRHYLLTASPRTVGDGVVLVHTDVTELEQARAGLERSLREVEALKERLQEENMVLQREVRHAHGFEELVGTSPALRRALAQVEQVAPTDAPVLLLGETGTGKDLVARAIHDRSRRRERTLVTVNCAALPATLVESEVFGYEKGAFTGAVQRTLGRFEVAHGGTLFLDEIGDLPLEAQAKLLRVLQTGEFERLGSSRTIKVDVRLVAATNHDLEAEVRAGRFRSDLYYRLGVFPIALPPLRDRPEDIPLLVWHFITQRQGRLGRSVKRVPERLMRAFASYPWPGNVRELENVVERALIMTSGSTLAADPSLLDAAPVAAADNEGTEESLAGRERAHIRAVLDRCGWRIAGRGNAAERLGVPRSTLQSRMKMLGISRPGRSR